MTRNHPDRETCPQCGDDFSAAANRAYPNPIVEAFAVKWLSAKITDSALVSCPKCRHRFRSNQVRFFGFLSLRQIRLVFLFYIGGLLMVGLFLAVTSW